MQLGIHLSSFNKITLNCIKIKSFKLRPFKGGYSQINNHGQIQKDVT